MKQILPTNILPVGAAWVSESCNGNVAPSGATSRPLCHHAIIALLLPTLEDQSSISLSSPFHCNLSPEG